MKKYLQATIEYIENNITEKLTLDEIAEHIGFSKYYLNQMFSVYTGYSLMAYTRLKKLEHALDLLETDRRIIDIAFELGYTSERAFTRAFTKRYGNAPSYFRHNKGIKSRDLVIYDLKLNVDEDKFFDYFPHNYESIIKKIKREGVDKIMSYLSDVKYVIVEPMTVISGIKRGSEPEEEIVGLMETLAKHYQLSPLRSFGFDSPVDSDEDPMIYRGYEFWHVLTDDDLEKLPSQESFVFEDTEIKIKHVPKRRYATLRITDPFNDAFERIPSGWKALHGWLDEHDFKAPDYKPVINGHCLEEVIEVDGVLIMDIFIPVE